MYWNSVSTFGALSSISVPQLWRDSLLFKGLLNISTTFDFNICNNEVTANQLKSTWCFHCAILWIDVLKFSIHFWGTSSSFQYWQLWRDSLLFKWILVLLSFIISNIPKSRRLQLKFKPMTFGMLHRLKSKVVLKIPIQFCSTIYAQLSVLTAVKR